MKIFFSHCSEDKEITWQIVTLLRDTQKKVKPFFSSDPDTGVGAGENLMECINREIKQCDLFIPVVTENYLRSIYCMYELSLAVFLKLEIVPLVASRALYEKLGKIVGNNILFIDASSHDGARIFANRFQIAQAVPQIEKILAQLAAQVRSLRPYIGMNADEYAKILQYCDTQGVKRLQNATMPAEEIKRKVRAAKELVLVSTTGDGVLKMLSSEALASALAAKCDIKIILPNQYAAFCADVAEIERPDDTEANLRRLSNEFSNVITYMNETVVKAKAASSEIGTVTVYCAYTLLRQTILLAKTEQSTWGWISMTLPPARTVDGTPSMEIECNNDAYSALMKVLFRYCGGITDIARKRGAVKTIDGATSSAPFFWEKRHATEYWKEKYQAARTNMENAAKYGDGVLIEVAAQHPLRGGKYPNEEFAARLDFASELYNTYKERGEHARIYVPGSRHRYNGVADDVSLSQAGSDYLTERGIPASDIWGENATKEFKGDDGVYNSADECFVAAKLFGKLRAAKLVCVCSPYQSHRKLLHYIEFGVVPLCYCTSVDNMFHDLLGEVFEAVPNVLYVDHSCQDRTGDIFVRSRQERKVD